MVVNGKIIQGHYRYEFFQFVGEDATDYVIRSLFIELDSLHTVV